jgi:hypothetical protein
MPTYFATGSFVLSGKLSKKDVADSDLEDALAKIQWPRAHNLQVSLDGAVEEEHLPVNATYFAPFDAYQVTVNGREFTVTFQGTLKFLSGGPFEGRFIEIGNGKPVTFLLRRLVVGNIARIVSTSAKPTKFSMVICKTKPKDVNFDR